MNKLLERVHCCASAMTLMLITGLVAAAVPSGFIYTANERDASISEITLATATVRTFKASVMAHNVQVTPDGRYLLVVGMPVSGNQMKDMKKMSGGEQGSLLIFDVRHLERPVATLPTGKDPAHVVTDHEGRRAFVTNSKDNAITVFDLTRRTVTGTISTGAGPHGLRPSPDGRELYVADVADGSVSVIDTTTLKEVARIPVGKAPVQVGFTPDGRQAYVSLRDEDKVAIIDVATRRVVAKVDVGRNPIQVFGTPDGKRMYVANQGSVAVPDDRASVIDVASRTVIATVTTGSGAHGVVVGDSGATAFITNIEAGTVSAVDTASQRVTATFKVGSGPNGISYRRK